MVATHKGQGADINLRNAQTTKKYRPFIAMNDRGFYLHMSGTCPTADREYAWQGTREQFVALQAKEAAAKPFALYRELDQ